MKYFVFLICLILAVSCKPTKETTSSETTITERLVEKEVSSPGESISTPINCDSILAFLSKGDQAGTVDTFFVESKQGLAQLKFYRDRLGRLVAECDSRDRTIKALVKELEIERTKSKEVTKEVPVEVEVEVIPSWVYPVLLTMGLIILIMLIILRYGKK